MPLDLVIIMLGTNDLKSRLGKPAGGIACGVGALLDIVANLPKLFLDGQPERLLIRSAPLGPLNLLTDTFAGGAKKFFELSRNYRGT